MLSNPNERALYAMASLRGHNDWRVVMEWLQENAKTLMQACAETKDDVTLRQSQGAAQVLAELLKLDDTSVTIAQKLRDKR